jgi:hypothetical protein
MQMADPHVISALRAKRAQVAGLIVIQDFNVIDRLTFIVVIEN